MRARRARLNNLRRDILRLENTAELGLALSFPSRENSRKKSYPPLVAEFTPINKVGGGQLGFSTGVEEAVIEDAERAVRLMPLKGELEEAGASPAGVASGMKDNAGDTVSGGVVGRWGYGRRLWRWLRGC